MNKEEIKNEFITCIEGSHTLNLAISVLEDREELKDKINKALNKIDDMFEVGDENKIIDDLLELEKILKGDNKEE